MAVSALTVEQQEIRSTGIGASEIAAVVGLNRYRGPIDVYARKLNLIPDEEAGEPAQWGNRLEQVIADAYAEEERIDPDTLWQPGTLRHPEHPVVLATPDRIRLSKRCMHSIGPGAHGAREFWDRNVQVKTASLRVADRWGEADDDIPEEYLVQIQYEMAVTGLDQTDLPVLIGGNEMRIYRLRADAELQDSLIYQAERFWRDHVQKREPPPVDGTEHWTGFLRARFPRDERPLLPATDEARDLLTALGRARRAKELAEETEASAINRLKAICGDAAGIESVCTWKATKPGQKVDYEAIVRASPGIPAGLIAQHTAVRPGYRRFLPKLAKKES
jgi:putative phage-type endonuclease